MILQMIRVAVTTIVNIDFQGIILIADAAFDCALILFGIGMIRLGKSQDTISNWLVAPILLFISAGLDILNIIFTSTKFGDRWSSEPLVFVNLTILIGTFLVLVVGFIFLKFIIDSLEKKEYIERKGQYYLPLGFLIYLIPSILGWYGGYIGEGNELIWQENLALFVYLFATFLIILGFLGLTSTMKLLQFWSHDQEEDKSKEEEEDV